jgi:retron-type reverse transcriptase
VIDVDIRGFFDNVPHDPILRAVEKHTDKPWVLLYVCRWLTAPVQQPDGTLVTRDRGTPQGSAISPLLSNLFMHYAFDDWLARMQPMVRFERYCDDAIRLGRRTDLSFRELATIINRVVAGWINYYGRFYKSLLIAFLADRINPHLVKWASRKFKHLHRAPAKARKRLVVRREFDL